MQPASYDFGPLRRGDTATLRCRLRARDIFTGEIGLLDLTGRTVTWRIGAGPGALVLAYGADAASLGFDPASSVLSVPLSASQTAALADATPYSVVVTADDGSWTSTRLTGRVLASGAPLA